MTSQRLGIEVLSLEGSITKLVAPPHITTRAVAIGSQAEVSIQGEGVAPEHLFAIVRDGRLLVASATTAIPVMMRAASNRPSSSSSNNNNISDQSDKRRDSSSEGLSESALPPARWVAIDLPCRIRLGDTVLRLFWCTSPRKTIQPPPSLMLGTAPPPGPDSEQTTQKRPMLWTEKTAPSQKKFDPPAPPRRKRLPPPTTPPRRAGSSTTAAAAARGVGSERERRGSHATLPSSQRAQDALTLPTPLPAPPASDASDAGESDASDASPPPSQATKVHPIAPNVPQGIPRMIVPTPARGTIVKPNTPNQGVNGASGETFLFQMATRAVDAWNRFVDDIDANRSKKTTPRMPLPRMPPR
jgi:hypothetical protein